MAPSASSSTKHAGRSINRESTPTTASQQIKGEQAAMAKQNPEQLATVFKDDLTNMRSLVTCTICDQLLYEPWTLGCGHTYCYSCLCNWFVQNRRKKTCPECRNAVKDMPAPAFLVKQIVEIFIKRTELMPSDESVDQHNERRAEEIADVDRDRSSSEGLFKGTFPPRRRELIQDDGDGVLRCPVCITEYEGGGACGNCGTIVERPNGEPYYFSDEDLDLEGSQFSTHLGHLEHLELDMDADVHHAHMGRSFAPFVSFAHTHDHTDSEDEDSYESDMDGDDEDDDNSIRDFIVNDDHVSPASRRSISGHNQRQLISISDGDASDDDDDDEEDIFVPTRRRRPTARPVSSPTPSTHSVVTVESSTPSDIDDEARTLQNAGWSPLDQDNDSDIDSNAPRYQYGGATEEDQDTDAESDTNTMVGNEPSDDDEDDQSQDNTETPRYQSLEPPGDHRDDYASDSDAGVTDQDGDTDMSASPGAAYYRRGGSRTTDSNVSTDGYGYGHEEPPSRNSNVNAPCSSRNNGQDLGVANHIVEVDDSSDEDEVQAPPRRRPRVRFNQGVSVDQYDVSALFAQYQQSRGLLEPSSRMRRTSTYRVHPFHRVGSARSSRSPSGRYNHRN